MAQVASESCDKVFRLQKLGDLDGVEGGAFEELVAADPEGEAVFHGAVAAKATSEAIVLSSTVERHRVAVGDILQAGCGFEGFEGFVDRNGALEFGTESDGVGAVDGHAHAGDGGFERRQVHDAAAFVFHFHLLFRVAGVEEGIDLRDDIEGDLVRENFLLDRFVAGDGVGLVAEFVDGAGSGAGYGLVGRGEDALHAKSSVERVQGHERDGRGAIRIRDDAAMAFHIVAIDFRNDERHLGNHAERRGVVHHNGTAIHSGLGVVAGDSAAGAEKGDVDIAEGVEGEGFDLERLPAKLKRLARRARRGEEAEVGDGEVAALHHAEHFHSDGSGRADDCDSIGFRHIVEV